MVMTTTEVENRGASPTSDKEEDPQELRNCNSSGAESENCGITFQNDSIEIVNWQMGQQTVDSKSSDHDKQLSVPVALMGPATKDSESENMIATSKSIESPLFPEVNNMANKVSNITGSKRPTPECLVNPLNRCSTNNSGTGHLVYVRRKPEGELSKTAANNNQSGVPDEPQLKKLSQHDEKTQTEVQMKEARYYIPEVSSISWTPSRCSLSTKPSVPPSAGESNNNLASVNVSNHQVTSTRLLFDNPKKVNFKHWEERYIQLQNLLRKLEQSKQEDYVLTIMLLNWRRGPSGLPWRKREKHNE
ncbi:uncharacterized protein LOC107879577 isoform X3 [Capsicum annuum]|uniref:uncharacterized protein LOC107879577 isoform X3 n=1 Tax=Capsicum annuum TaxID=4072 RepID=UPI001FB0BDFA|nr:uncharacterized protein LOC107879577 isoform X3 [Capsicum annuum]